MIADLILEKNIKFFLSILGKNLGKTFKKFWEILSYLLKLFLMIAIGRGYYLPEF